MSLHKLHKHIMVDDQAWVVLTHPHAKKSVIFLLQPPGRGGADIHEGIHPRTAGDWSPPREPHSTRSNHITIVKGDALRLGTIVPMAPRHGGLLDMRYNLMHSFGHGLCRDACERKGNTADWFFALRDRPHRPPVGHRSTSFGAAAIVRAPLRRHQVVLPMEYEIAYLSIFERIKLWTWA
ncbi:hypothetical protein BD779DRAFT_1477949 [Infundibulicybe gibba]|nr:hypothetical protein BD779DRAFT_1477949 [Infundibulicybe gibba]